jgi:hypothetical protein
MTENFCGTIDLIDEIARREGRVRRPEALIDAVPWYEGLCSLVCTPGYPLLTEYHRSRTYAETKYRGVI